MPPTSEREDQPAREKGLPGGPELNERVRNSQTQQPANNQLRRKRQNSGTENPLKERKTAEKRARPVPRRSFSSRLPSPQGTFQGSCRCDPHGLSSSRSQNSTGWVDNFNGITGIITAMGKGLLRSMKGTPRAVADIIPVDIVANLILAVGWYTAVHRPKSTRIYHCTSGALNPCCWRDIAALMVASFEKVPLEQTFWRPNAELYGSTLAKKYWNMVSHWCPVVICDLYLRLTGRKPRFMKVMSRIQKMLSLLEYFVSHSWEWSVNSSEMLRAQLSPEDQRVFNFDVRQLNWLEYIENYVVGVKKHLLKEEMSGVPKAKEHLKKLRNIQYLFNTALVLLAWHLLVTRSQVMRNIWFFLVNSCSKLLPCLRAPRVSRV
nr:unnamed protein product [Sorex araneus]